MQVRMNVGISGTRNGKPWPGAGEVVDLPDNEGAELCRQKLATPVTTDSVETAVPSDEDVEVRDEPAGESEPVDPREIRKWAKDEGLDVPARGPLPAELVELYREANG